MIHSLNIAGFRSLRDAEWRPGRLNIVIGANASGKSNLLHALELFASIASGKFREYIIDAGGIGPLLWNGEGAPGLRFSLTTNPIEVFVEPDHAFLYSGRIDGTRKHGGFWFASELLSAGIGEQPAEWLQFYKNSHGNVFVREKGELKKVEREISSGQSALSLFSNDLHISAFCDSVSNWLLYRGLQVDANSLVRSPAVSRVESHLSSDGSDLVPVLHTHYYGDRNFKATLDRAMGAAFGEEYEELAFPPAADQRVQLAVRWRSLHRPISAAYLSDGTLRFLALVTMLADPEPPRLVAIDEPEASMHPRMLPILAELAASAAERTQVILLTHSADLLTAFTPFDATPTVVQLVEGATCLKSVDQKQLTEWLRHYTLGELFRSGELEQFE